MKCLTDVFDKLWEVRGSGKSDRLAGVTREIL